ncbi:Gfo/Idh/MocA family protein [Paenibacillus sp. NPDC058071]|uniref:Gfo/Idh/MocA family protein n=1 Tax=Paenibacillus sp. NPDC058071 TaxID=3346326 RepID=UPI0036DE9230
MIHFAIVGCGHIAYKHAEAIREIDSAQISAVCDTNPATLDKFVELTGARGYLNLEEMLGSEPDVDVVCICTPSGLHARLAVTIARAGKHLIIEKPLALTLEDADRIQEAAKAAGVKAAVVHPNRYRPAILRLKQALERGAFGKLSHVNATVRWNRGQAYYDQAPWRGTQAMDGGVLMNQAIHSLDLLQWLFGEVEQIKAMVDTRVRRIEAEDVAVATLRFEDGTLGLVEAATTVYEKNLEETISVFGEDGYAVIGGVTANWIKHWKSASMSDPDIAALIEEIENDPYGQPGHRHIIEDMIGAIRDDREPAVTVEDGRRAVKLVLDIVNEGQLTGLQTI